MGSRAMQLARRAIELVLIVALGTGVALLIISWPWSDSSSDAPPVAEPATNEPAAAPTPEPAAASTVTEAPPPQSGRRYTLPKLVVASATPEVRIEPEKKPAAPVLVPKDWLLRGTGSQHYMVSSDKEEVLSGTYSVKFASHDKNVASTQFASLMQSVVAEPWLGKRVVFSLSTKRRGWVQDVELWIRALDAGRVVIAHNAAGTRYAKLEWRKDSVAIDVPWSAAEIAYGVNLRASGAIWLDAAELQAVDRNVPVAAVSLPGELGVVAQEVREQGPLARPSNMDFEDVGEAAADFRLAPKDQLGRSRF